MTGNQTSHPATNATNATEVDSVLAGNLPGSPLARLAAALTAYRDHNSHQTWEYPTHVEEFYGSPQELAAAILAADPTLVCPDPADHDLAAAVRQTRFYFTKADLEWALKRVKPGYKDESYIHAAAMAMLPVLAALDTGR